MNYEVRIKAMRYDRTKGAFKNKSVRLLVGAETVAEAEEKAVDWLKNDMVEIFNANTKKVEERCATGDYTIKSVKEVEAEQVRSTRTECEELENPVYIAKVLDNDDKPYQMLIGAHDMMHVVPLVDRVAGNDIIEVKIYPLDDVIDVKITNKLV